MLYCRTVRTIFVCAALTALTLLATGCVMPDRNKQIAHNEAKLAAEGYTALVVGDPAPAIPVVAADGATIYDPATPLAGPLLLFFIPAVETPNSAQQTHKLNAAAAELSNAGVTTAVVLAEEDAAALAFQAEHCPALAVVADPTRSVSIAYGCATAGAEFLQRTQVGISAAGAIAFYERGFPLINAKMILERFGLGAAK